jgi:hypothetical protein
MPNRIGRYVVRRRIGSGGFATVWLADDEHLDSPVAIKVLADNWSEDHQIRRRFLEEGKYLRKVESPHVVTVYDAGELDDGRPYLVMSYADQGTLADRLQDGPLSVGQAMDVVRQVGAGLQALHDRGILHRDIKPANVLFRTVERSGGDPQVRAMVGDLGLGKALDVSSRLTMIAGTPSFVAPEQAGAESPDARADQYSLAALAYLLLTGRTPHAHKSLAEAANPGALAPASTTARPFPPAVDAALRRGLSRERKDRFPDVTSFVTALDDALRGVDLDAAVPATYVDASPQPTRPAPTPSSLRARRLGLAMTACAAALGVGAVTGYAVQHAVAADERTVTDATGTLSVTVPAAWDRADATDGWRPPDAETDYPALAVGSSPDWTDVESSGSGTFVGLLPGSKLPADLPQHAECGTAGSPVRDIANGDSSLTVVYSDCPGGIVVERVVQVTADELLWVQVRSEERATANDVLDGVHTHGMG